jgi:D-apiose dehydrogenase
MRVGVIGSGFWAQFQVGAWKEIFGVEVVGIASLDTDRREMLATQYSIPFQFESAEELVKSREIDLVDVISSVSAHAEHVRLAIDQRKTVICQKPLTERFSDAQQLVAESQEAGIRLLVHENWRYQEPFLQVRSLLNTNVIGKVHRARMQMTSGFPVLQYQPDLGKMDRFILSDLGIHVLDTARSLFGEARSVYCLTTKTQEIRGENVASVLLEMNDCPIVSVEIGYAGTWSEDHFPETYALIEGDLGSIEIRRNHQVLVTTQNGIETIDATPSVFSWVDPRYALVQSSIVPCIQSMVDALRSGQEHPLDGSSNLKSMQIVEACYKSAEIGNRVILEE